MILHHARCAIARRRSKKKGSPKREDVPPKKSKDVPPKRDHQRKREDVPQKKNKDVPPKRDRQKEIGITAKAYSHLLQTNKQKSPLANKQKESAGRTLATRSMVPAA